MPGWIATSVEVFFLMCGIVIVLLLLKQFSRRDCAMGLQKRVNQLLCGESIWAPMPGYVIVGFEVRQKIWEGKPTQSDWDNIDSVRVVESFASAGDAEALERRLREQRVPHRSYETLPIQVRAPSHSEPNMSAPNSQ